MRKNPLKLKYGLVLKSSCVLSLVIVILIMVLFPRFNTRSDIGAKGLSKAPLLVPPPIVDVEIPPNKQPALPVVPIESPDDQLEVDFPEPPANIYDIQLPLAPPPPPEAPNKRPDTLIIWEEAPEPVGGLHAIQQRVRYPDLARELGLEGRVVIKAYINSEGIVEDCIVVKGIPNSGLNEAAITAIRATPFKPAMQGDRPVGVYFHIPINFKLN